VTLTVSPAAGRPGSVVTVVGRLASPVRHRGMPELCWDGCIDGLQFTGVAQAPKWTSATTFRARLRLPAAPWIEGDPARVVPLSAGSYPIGVVCVVSKRLCGLATPEGTGWLELDSSAPPAWCRTQVYACGSAELAATSATHALLLRSLSRYLVVGSSDGGSTWADVRLPPIPSPAGRSGSGLPSASSPELPGPGGLALPPDGALLISGEQTQWELLAPHARSWCRVTSVPGKLQRAETLSAIFAIGGRLWWLTAKNPGPTRP
jgi:hypothetical protein